MEMLDKGVGGFGVLSGVRRILTFPFYLQFSKSAWITWVALALPLLSILTDAFCLSSLASVVHDYTNCAPGVQGSRSIYFLNRDTPCSACPVVNCYEMQLQLLRVQSFLTLPVQFSRDGEAAAPRHLRIAVLLWDPLFVIMLPYDVTVCE